MPRPFEPVTPPPLAQQEGQTFPRLVELMQRLLAPDGCPWDREQSFATLRRYVIEEACEVVDAIEGGDRGELRGELGDLLLQVVFQAELARAEGSFGPDDVVAAICDKLVRRHPHVFAGAPVEGTAEVLRNWERIKAAERAGKKKERAGLLSGVPRSLPALMRAQRVGEKVARVGFDWPDARGSRAKVGEEPLRPGQPGAPRRRRRRGRPPAHHRQVHPPLRPRRGPRPRGPRRLARLRGRRQAGARGAGRLLGGGQARGGALRRRGRRGTPAPGSCGALRSPSRVILSS
jgi:NTP pyrophosphatase (non-canonical NTP hydrolase)